MSRSNKDSIGIIFFCWLAYMISYLGRSDYSACILEIVNETKMARATAGMVSSVLAFCMAIGQIVSGFVMKKIAPIKVIGAELFSVAVINLLFPNTNSFLLMAVLWGINGCMQSTLLCGATQIYVETLKEPYLSYGVVSLNTIGAIGGALNYILSWVLIKYISWKAVFTTVSTMLLVVGIGWSILMPKLTAKRSKQVGGVIEAEKLVFGKKSFLMLFTHYGTAFAVPGAFFIGLLRESVSLWIPSYMNEVFGLSSSLSTIITMFVPCLQVCGALLGGKIGHKVYNLHFAAGTVFLLSGVSLILIMLSGAKSTVVTMLLFVTNAICMTGALTFLLSLFPIRFFGKGQAPILVGIINFFVHIGDFVSSSGIGWLSQAGGWKMTFGVLSGLAFMATAICILGGFVCQKEVSREDISKR